VVKAALLLGIFAYERLVKGICHSSRKVDGVTPPEGPLTQHSTARHMRA
jgi:hypothetical protein